MVPMVRLRYLIPVAILCVGAVVSWRIQYTTRVELRTREEASRRRAEQLAVLEADNQQLSDRIAKSRRAGGLTGKEFRELLRLRSEVGLLRQTVREIDRVRATNRQYRAELARSEAWTDWERPVAGAENTQSYWPRDHFGFAGFADPESALRTTLWMWVDADLVSLLPLCTPEQRSELEAVWGERSETEMAALRQRTAALYGLDRGGVSVMGKRMTSPDEALVDLYFEGDGKRRRFSLSKSGDQWVVTELVAIYN